MRRVHLSKITMFLKWEDEEPTCTSRFPALHLTITQGFWFPPGQDPPAVPKLTSTGQGGTVTPTVLEIMDTWGGV